MKRKQKTQAEVPPERTPARFDSLDAWHAEGRRRFGDDKMQWAFLCPSCGHRWIVSDWKDAGATEGEVAFSCVGRHLEGSGDLGSAPGPCNYAGGGLFKLNPVSITIDGTDHYAFAFAAPEPSP